MPTTIIAELCQNHNGDVGLMKEMAAAAKENGADYVKIQTIFSSMVTFRDRFELGAVGLNGTIKSVERPFKAEVERLSRLEVSYDDQANFVDYCAKLGVKPLTTAFTVDSVEKIKQVGFEEIKIASYDCASPPLLRAVKSRFKNIYVSTGATFDYEIEEAAKILYGSTFSFLHCVTIYPTPLVQFHLSRMSYLRRFSKYVGWSDHSDVVQSGIKGTLAAIYFGADIVERHFTLLKPEQSRDGLISVNSAQLRAIREFADAESSYQADRLAQVYPGFRETLGDPARQLSDAELRNRDYYRGRFGNRRDDGTHQFNWEEQ